MRRKKFDKKAIEEKVAAMSNEQLFDERMQVNLEYVSPGGEAEFEVDCLEIELHRRLTALGFFAPAETD